MSDPSAARRIPLCEPSLSGNERAYLDECVTSGFVSSVGPFVDRFERAFAARVGAPHAIACASGTAALHIACRLAGVTRGDEVFVATLTFIASANPIRYEHAQAVLVDAEAETWNQDPALIIAELDRRAAAGRRQPRAVIAVHILGMPARLDDLAAACTHHGVVLIEDAAEALGAQYTQGPFAGRSVGTIGRIGAYSFNGNKIITAGGGGMITTADPELARRARHLTTQARLPGAEYRHDEVGYNYRLTNLAAAVGLAQLEQLDDFLACKRAIADRYDDAFVDLPGFSRPQRVAWGESSNWLYAIAVHDERAGVNREALATILSERGIDSRPIWTPLHLQAPYNQAPRLGGAVAERLFRGGLCLPSSAGLTVAEQDRVIAAVRMSTKGL